MAHRRIELPLLEDFDTIDREEMNRLFIFGRRDQHEEQGIIEHGIVEQGIVQRSVLAAFLGQVASFL